MPKEKNIDKLIELAEKKKKQFAQEFDITLELLSENYPRFTKGKEDPERSVATSKLAIATILIQTLQQIQADSTKMLARDFHSKYFPNLEILDCSDFTRDEIKEIIDMSPLDDQEKRIAVLFFCDCKNQTEIYEEIVDIGDKKTITAKIEEISEIMKHTAILYNKN